MFIHWVLSTKVCHSLEFWLLAARRIQTIPLKLFLLKEALFTAAVKNQCFSQSSEIIVFFP